MNIYKIKNLEYIPAGHENPQNPGVVKKIIFTINDIRVEGAVQMINWARMEPGKSFRRHYHEYMDEIYIIISGKAEILIDDESSLIEATDTVFIPQGSEHEMKNTATENLDYIVIGITGKPCGKTVVTDRGNS